MAKSISMPSDAQMQILCKVALAISKEVKNNSSKVWKNRSTPVMIFSIIAVLGMIGTLIYYIMTSSIAPLLIYIACLMPILAFGLTQSTKNLQKVNQEFAEYSTAMGKLLSVLLSNSDEAIDDITCALAAAIAAATTVVPESVDDVTFGDLRKMPEFQSAVALAKHLCCVNDAINNLKKEGIDVESLLSSLDIEDYDAEEFYDGQELLDTLVGKTQDTETNDSTGKSEEIAVNPSENADAKEPISENDSHIINGENGDIHEDLSIVV